MEMPSMALAMRIAIMAMAMIVVLSGRVFQGAEAQSVTCAKVEGADASISDANELVENMRLNTGLSCPTTDYCNVMVVSGNAQAIGCGFPLCMDCQDVGNGLNEVLAQCNDANGVQGTYWFDGATGGTVLLTAASTTIPTQPFPINGAA